MKKRKNKEKYFDRNQKMLEFLKILAGAAFLGAVVINPIIPFALKPLFKDKEDDYPDWELKRLIRSANKNDFISVEDNGKVSVTPKGDMLLRIDKIHNVIIDKSKTWDKKFRLIIFDIPNTKKNSRDTFRRFLISNQFYMLQESVFITPYACEEEIRGLAEILDIWDEINIIRADRIDREESLKKHFHLS